jgi:hypothetical protein
MRKGSELRRKIEYYSNLGDAKAYEAKEKSELSVIISVVTARLGPKAVALARL